MIERFGISKISGTYNIISKNVSLETISNSNISYANDNYRGKVRNGGGSLSIDEFLVIIMGIIMLTGSGYTAYSVAKQEKEYSISKECIEYTENNKDIKTCMNNPSLLEGNINRTQG